MNISKNVKISQLSTVTAGAAAATAINGTHVDMAGYDGVLFIIPFGAIVSGAVTSVKAQQGALANDSDMADLAGTGQTVVDTADDTTFYIDVFRPAEQYVRPVVSRATQNATVGGITAIQYKGSKFPTTHGSAVSGETHVSPDEGTA